MSDPDLPGDLRAWVEDATGGKLTRVTRVMGGASREAWLVDVGGGDGTTELFLRRDNGTGPMQGTPYTIGREASVYRALAGSAVPVARVVASHADGNTVLLTRVEGEAYFPAAGDAREALADEFAGVLAALHALDVDTLDLPELARPATPEEHATLELDVWEQLQRDRGRPDPLVDFTFRWLRARVPATVDRTVLVQGDTGPGNFMFRDGHIVAVVDWELAHLGDPMEDLAWLVTRSLLQPWVPLGPWLRAYEARSGIAVDETRLRWWLVANVLRCVIGEGVVVAAGVPNPERGMIYALLQMHRRVVVDALDRAEGRVPPVPELAPIDTPPSERSALYGLVADTIETALVPSVDDPMAAHQGRSAARLVRYLELVDRVGAEIDEEDRAGIAALLDPAADCRTAAGARDALRAAIARGEVADAALLGYFRAETTRHAPLVRPLLGRLATVELADWSART